MNFIMIGLLLREALDRLCVRLNMYLVVHNFIKYQPISKILSLSYSLQNCNKGRERSNHYVKLKLACRNITLWILRLTEGWTYMYQRTDMSHLAIVVTEIHHSRLIDFVNFDFEIGDTSFRDTDCHHHFLTERDSCAKKAFCSNIFLLLCHTRVQSVILWIFQCDYCE